ALRRDRRRAKEQLWSGASVGPKCNECAPRANVPTSPQSVTLAPRPRPAPRPPSLRRRAGGSATNAALFHTRFDARPPPSALHSPRHVGTQVASKNRSWDLGRFSLG